MKISILIYCFFISLSLSQQLDVTFRYVKEPTESFNRIFVPGTMPDGTSNDWGPNSNGVISPSAPSQMIYNENNDSYEKSYSLQIGQEYLYKLHFHYNASGGDYAWVSDPMNPETTSDGWDNSILYVTDPLFFQPARHLNDDGLVNGLSLGIHTNSQIDSIRYKVGNDNFISDGYFFEKWKFLCTFSSASFTI